MNFLEFPCNGMSSFAAAITVPLIIAYVYYHYYGTVHCGCAANIESERNTSITLITSSVCVLRHCVLRMQSDKKKKKAKANSINGCGYSMYQKDDLKQAKAIITEGVIDCIIEDGRPFRFAEG
eukprot:434181_1